MDAVTVTLVFLIVVALGFDFINGMHDSANSIATIVSTRVLKPQYAVLWAAFFNFAAFFLFSTNVASTVGKGIVDPKLIDPAAQNFRPLCQKDSAINADRIRKTRR